MDDGRPGACKAPAIEHPLFDSRLWHAGRWKDGEMKNDSAWNVATASLMHSRDGSFIRVSERPLRALLLEPLGDRIFGFCNWGDWAYKVRWGPVDDEYGIADRSLGHCLWVLGQWAGRGIGTWKQERVIADIPVTEDWVQVHYPDAGFPFTNDEQMRSTPGDQGDVYL